MSRTVSAPAKLRNLESSSKCLEDHNEDRPELHRSKWEVGWQQTLVLKKGDKIKKDKRTIAGSSKVHRLDRSARNTRLEGSYGLA